MIFVQRMFIMFPLTRFSYVVPGRVTVGDLRLISTVAFFIRTYTHVNSKIESKDSKFYVRVRAYEKRNSGQWKSAFTSVFGSRMISKYQIYMSYTKIIPFLYHA